MLSFVEYNWKEERDRKEIKEEIEKEIEEGKILLGKSC